MLISKRAQKATLRIEIQPPQRRVDGLRIGKVRLHIGVKDNTLHQGADLGGLAGAIGVIMSFAIGVNQ